ncbi:MAG: hypothetical protein K1X92_02980 [Bacteroidia bacterium]|nr:hypothetical protein [Bacteroidia bacterium]
MQCKLCVCLLLFLFPALLNAQNNPVTEDLPEKLKTQLKNSSTPALIYRKEVVDLTQNPVKVETQTFTADTLNRLMLSETDYALAYFAGSPKLKPYFDETRVNDTIHYKIKTAEYEKSPLKVQKILRNPQNNIIYWESHCITGNFLYRKEINIKVYFDSRGKYSHHFLKIYLRMEVINQIFHTLISGSRK